MRTALFAFLIVSSISCAAGDECRSADLRLALRDPNPQVVKILEDRWARAYANRDTVSLDCILAEDFQIGSIPDQAFELHDKRHVLEWITKRTGSAELDQLQIQSYDTAVVARGTYSVRKEKKLVTRFQFSDFFVYRGNRWQAVARILAKLPVL